MPRGDEARVVAAFCDWLRLDGWQVSTEVRFVDVLAKKDGVTMLAEAKGLTSAPGLDVDTAYGQLLRRMPTEDRKHERYALVVPNEALTAALRVPYRVRALLGLEVFAVAQDGTVTRQA